MTGDGPAIHKAAEQDRSWVVDLHEDERRKDADAVIDQKSYSA